MNHPITLPVAELKPVLTGLTKVISKRTMLPVLGYVRIARTSNGAIELAATDLDVSAIATLPTPTQGEPTSLLIPFEDLQNVTKSCSRSDSLIVTLVDKQRAAIKFPVANQVIEHRCESPPVEEFPTIAEIRETSVVLNESVRRAISEALQCASDDPTRLILMGAYIDVSKPKAHYVVGTDGRHLFSSNSFAIPLAESILIPSHRFIEWKEFNADGDWALKLAKPEKDGPLQFEITSNHWRFIARSIEGNYPNWRQVVPSSEATQTTIEVKPESVEAILQTIARMPNHDPVHHTLGLEAKGSQVRLLGKSAQEDTWTRVEIPGAKAKGADLMIKLNRHLLAKALRFGLTRIEIIDSLSPLKFSEGGRQMVVMPVRPDAVPPPQSATPPAEPDSADAQPEPIAPNTPPTAEQPKGETMSDTNGTSGTAKRPATNAPETTGKTALETGLAQIEVIRGDFRNAIAGLNKLADALKQAQREQKASDKEIQSVRQTLRSLQTVRI